MKTIKKLTLGLAAILLACSSVVQAKLTIYAAASLTNALQDVAAEYKKDKPTEDIVFSFASSSTLAKQIEEGAPADIFISANNKWMKYLSEKNLTAKNTEKVLLGNDLVMIAPKKSAVENVDISQGTWIEQLKGQFLSVGDPDHVPAGQYMKESLIKLGLWEQVEPRLARGKDVRAALALVEQSEVPLGVVYATDAKVSQKVKVVGIFPEGSYTAVEYPVAALKGRDNAEVQDFLNYLSSERAKNIFVNYGFSVK
ncbi:molybdate ABC transporter substrate-binding protein [Conservatibacter flavescens]|uniref:Molybdate ABC transporter substrate-binding protein n=1 Tax=Conservatibacter flavescens TaxID=28161 RepID=A0A2M8S3X6_9PAST|nr:molybdate ABC transporter substrate-binding protein [Conservatibacter flavescens]PJG85855.1 molybdate ABC transporter substrate-binding protein [Conservatibacter flavescens]